MLSLRAFALAITTSFMLVLPASALAQNGSGGVAFPTPTPTPTPTPPPAQIVVPGAVAQLLPDGTAAAPADAPPQVQQAIYAANLIQDKPYIYGGGHRSFHAAGYDCSGSVSYVLHGMGRLDVPMDSGELMHYGRPGPGRFVTIYANAGHAFMVIDGRRFDTSGTRGTRWQTSARSTAGYVARHPAGL